jgi:succinate--hydroxymethylglutarate CoA-transferase
LPCAPVLDRGAVNADEQLAARRMLTEVQDADGETVAVVGDPLSAGTGLPEGFRACPRLGEHTDEVLGDWLTLDADEIAKLREAGAVA